MPPRAKADGDPSQDTSDVAADAGPVVRLALNSWPVDRFEHGIDGVPVLTPEGVDVPADQEEAVRAAAKDAGLSVKKVSE